MDPRRRRLLTNIRELLGVRYDNGAALPTNGRRPERVDCSGLIRWVCQEVFGGDGRLSAGEWIPTARTMFEKLPVVVAPAPADLALYSRNDGVRGEVWHVMMCTEDNGVIGACDEAGEVREYSRADYAATWRLRGYRVFPLDG